MASTINASTSPAAIIQTADGTDNLNLQSNGSTVLALTSSGVTVTGTLNVSGSPISVSAGGTGAASQTAYAVLAGGTTSTGAYQSVASVGTSGQVLMSNGAGALPTFQTISTQAFPSGTKMSFYQASAPTGWTKDTTADLNDAILRIVTGSGGATGGSTAFSTWAAVTSTSSYTLATADIPSHSHTATNGGSPFVSANGISTQSLVGSGSPVTASTANTGGGGGHSHGVSSQNLKYADFIVATAN
jgi:hypothetical protein